MKRLTLVLAVAFTTSPLAFQAANPDLARWKQEAANVTIVRDDWGIAHVFGKTDADAVFGMEYAQAEDDFNRVETNYINAMGRLAEAEGESEIYRDLRMKLFIDPDVLKKDYAASPAWLKTLMNAFADGLNYYLDTHPNVKPRVIMHFEPWMALSFTEGSIGGDIERVNLRQLQAFYGGAASGRPAPAPADHRDDFQPPPEPSGSNGIAIAPSNTVDHHALLLINPHTSFYFRSELQMVSDEGLDAYGAVTWGQFFIYQGFNPHVGWMHTSSAVDAIDEFLETVTKQGDRYYYKHGTDELPVDQSVVTVPYKTDQGMAEKRFTVYRTMHGPVIADVNGKWETIALMNEPVKALTQSYTRTKATDYKSFLQTMQLHTNSSNNTIFADSDGDIAYFHGNYIPRRDPSFDWTRPVDGSNPATDYHGLLSVDETPHLVNPASGWLYNSNDWPWDAAGPSSPKQEDFPKYVDNGGPSARGQHAVRVLQNKKDFTLDGLLAAAFDSYLTWFEKPIPALVKAWDEAPATDPLKARLADQIDVLRHWDLRWGADSIATSLAVYWGTDLQRSAGGRGRGTAAAARGAGRGAPAGRAAAAGRGAGRGMFQDRVGSLPPELLLQSLAAGSDKLTADFGTWKTPWGDINRFQRLNDNIASNFDDSKPSIPVPFTSATWGSLASFGARQYPNTKKWYGTSGNSFVAVVEFGPTIHARAVTAGGESGDPKSPHFNDEAERYASGNLREVYFYRSQLTGHTERTYHPGS
jgi:acyl-homoserine-lactone acylase